MSDINIPYNIKAQIQPVRLVILLFFLVTLAYRTLDPTPVLLLGTFALNEAGSQILFGCLFAFVCLLMISVYFVKPLKREITLSDNSIRIPAHGKKNIRTEIRYEDIQEAEPRSVLFYHSFFIKHSDGEEFLKPNFFPSPDIYEDFQTSLAERLNLQDVAT